MIVIQAVQRGGWQELPERRRKSAEGVANIDHESVTIAHAIIWVKMPFRVCAAADLKPRTSGACLGHIAGHIVQRGQGSQA